MNREIVPHYHFIGIGGIGMSALALILVARGAKVSGSDRSNGYLLDSLRKEGIEVFVGHSADNLQGSPTVIFSSAVAQDNPEYQKAQALQLPLWHRADLLAKLMEGSCPLLVAGTHGKTTTSSILAHTLIDAGLDPSYAIGGIAASLGTNGHKGEGTYFVAEADESDGSFLKFFPFGAIITNIDNDHYDYWKSEQELLLGFKKFAEKVASLSHFFWCADDERLVSLKLKGESYGFSSSSSLYINNYRQEGWKIIFDITFDGKFYSEIEIPLIGGHNVLNASAVFGLAVRLHIPEEKIRQAFSHFRGVGRRMEKKGEARSITVYDDYGHHPTEIFATLRALKATQMQGRLVIAFQPHRYTRTRDCMDQFANALSHADAVILTDIYGAGEKPLPGVSSQALAENMKSHSSAFVHYTPREELVSYLTSFLQPKDVLVTMGAGDITAVGPQLLERL